MSKRGAHTWILDDDSGWAAVTASSPKSLKRDKTEHPLSKSPHSEGSEKRGSQTNRVCLQAPQSTSGEGKIPLFSGQRTQIFHMAFPAAPSLYSPRYSYHNIAGCVSWPWVQSTTATLAEFKQTNMLLNLKTIETGGRKGSQTERVRRPQFRAWPRHGMATGSKTKPLVLC